MPDTLIVQSHRSPLPWPWLAHCLASVRDWCDLHGFAYRFIGDELFDCLPAALQDKTRQQRVVAADLARLLVLRQALDAGHARVVWLDADVLVFEPEALRLPDAPYAVGREVWVQEERPGRLKVYKRVHNAFLMFCRSNSFLDFYTETAQRLLSRNRGPVPPQFIGPKLLSALHNVASLPVLETAGMLSPLVIRDIIAGGGAALTRFAARSPAPLRAANLCASSCDSGAVSAGGMQQAIDALRAGRLRP